MPVTVRKRRRKKVRYSKLVIKLSAKQKKSLQNYCKARKTTPSKLIKKLIRRYITGFDKEVPKEYSVTENQLDLWDEISTDNNNKDFHVPYQIHSEKSSIQK
jgi:hypothetical protein